MRRLLALAAVIGLALGLTVSYVTYAPAAGVGPSFTPMNVEVSGTVTPGWTTIGGDVAGVVRLAGRHPYLSVQVTNTTDGNDATISGFRLQYRTWPGGSWSTKWAGTDWANSAVFSQDCWIGLDGDEDGNTNSHYVYQLAASEYCALNFWIGPVDAVRFQAKVDANTATISVRGMAN